MALGGLKERWEKLVKELENRFSPDDELDVQSILFLIGVQELGQGFRTFNKNEKMDLMHIATCAVLSRYDFYSFIGRDPDGWPHWKKAENIPALSEGQQSILLKEAIVLYFEEGNY